jgi:formylglycine-generating enzyme
MTLDKRCAPMRGPRQPRCTHYVAANIAAVAVAGVLAVVLAIGQPANAAPECKGPAQHTGTPGEKSGMVFVPGGVFTMGSERERPEERYTHLVRVDGFWIDTHEVTNDQFAAFVDATGYVTQAERKPKIDRVAAGNDPGPGAAVFIAPTDFARGGDLTQWWQFVEGANWRHPEGPGSTIEGRETHPVVAITYADALAYAKWRGHELPTEAEWEYASRGGRGEGEGTSGAYENGKPVANTWQGIFPVLNSDADGYAGSAPVGCFKPNGYGLHDMIGNVWEWTSDWYRRAHDRKPAVNPAGPSAPVRFDAARRPSKVIKGGSYLCAFNYCARYRSTARQPQEPDLGAAHIGFRTVLRVPYAQAGH